MNFNSVTSPIDTKKREQMKFRVYQIKETKWQTTEGKLEGRKKKRLTCVTESL